MWQNIVQSFRRELRDLSDTFSFRAGLCDLGSAAGCRFCARLPRPRWPAGPRTSCVSATPALPQSRPGGEKNPIWFALLLIALAIALPAAQLGSDGRLIFVRFLVLGTICLIGWTSLTVLHLGANLYLRNFRIDAPHDLLARKHVTQVRVLMRVLDIIIVLVTLGFALMTFDTVRQYGIGVFASAGIAGVVFSLAAQPVLSNLIAEIQLAMTQPIRLEDAVTVQNEIRLDRGDHRDLCCHPSVGSTATDRAAQLFHSTAVL